MEEKYEKWAKERIAKELTADGDLLPPWQKFPEYQSGSLAWRMGDGEAYMIAWDTWRGNLSQEQLVEYFKKYAPIPVEWLTFAASRCGFREISSELRSGTGEFAGIRWLEQQGLASYSEFKSWYENTWTKRTGKR
jgi:hypothetical protein